MKQKQNFIILAILGFAFLLCWIVVLTLVIKTWRGSKEESSDPVVVDVTLCDENASDLCVVSFGANSINRMVINFQLPSAGYTPFYVKANNRGTIGVYSCETNELTLINAHCTGIRTPLGETIDIEVYTTDGDKLIARGTFLVSAIALSTPISLPADTAIPIDTPVEETPPTPTPIEEVEITATPELTSPTP